MSFLHDKALAFSEQIPHISQNSHAREIMRRSQIIIEQFRSLAFRIIVVLIDHYIELPPSHPSRKLSPSLDSLNLPDTILRQLDVYAASQGFSRSEAVISLLENYQSVTRLEEPQSEENPVSDKKPQQAKKQKARTDILNELKELQRNLKR